MITLINGDLVIRITAHAPRPFAWDEYQMPIKPFYHLELYANGGKTLGGCHSTLDSVVRYAKKSGFNVTDQDIETLAKEMTLNKLFNF